VENKKTLIIICAAIILSLIQINLNSAQRGLVIPTNIEKGVYIPADIVTLKNMKYLPIPKDANDYVFYQSIQKISNVVIGRFKQGNREIILLQDNDNDGKVDLAAHWMIETNIIDREGEPEKFCTAENFRKLKEAIVNGKSESFTIGGKAVAISPNRGAFPQLETIIKSNSNILKSKEGMRVFKVDPDELSSEMDVFTYSINSKDGTVDLAFDIKYYYSGQNRTSPIINMCVYCLKSQDPYAIETVKKISDLVSRYYQK